jgi:hypothetical protein
MPAGLGGGGFVGFQFESVLGTPVDTATGSPVWIPIISESLHYVEDKYYSEAIRQQTIDNDVKSSYYHVEGDIVAEVDTNWLAHMLYCSRHAIAKTGAADPWTYTFTPSSAGAASTAASGAVPRTCSLTVVRNGVVFIYAGCIVNNWEFTIENGVLRVTMGILGVSEATGAVGTPTWAAPELFGADAHSIYVAASGAAPAFGAASVDFNGFTCTFNYNAAAQNRIMATRGASYISFGKTEAGYTTELDFINRTEYDNFKAASTRAVRLESVRPSGTFAASTEAVQITFNRSAYDAYDIGLGGIGDLIMAGVTGHGLSQVGGQPYAIVVKSAISIT